ncbi:hypothetical protein F4779DRAFT_634949 [Xylariaceae sp. FL0662B]|nr:hypothetical protein F4779DRAFT_634949 [Xylariaceae sp. FL0662B]
MASDASVVAKDFPRFLELPLELRAMIWQFGVRAQNRVVYTDGLRKVKYASCPVLFVVCKESKIWAEKLYKRLLGDNLLYCKLRPSYFQGYGPIISLDDDIIHLGNWKEWAVRCSHPVFWSLECHRTGRPLPPICRRIEEFSKNIIRRIAVTPGWFWSRQSIVQLYKKAHKTMAYEQAWPYLWAQNIEEVWDKAGSPHLEGLFLLSNDASRRGKQKTYEIPILVRPEVARSARRNRIRK